MTLTVVIRRADYPAGVWAAWEQDGQLDAWREAGVVVDEETPERTTRERGWVAVTDDESEQ